MPRVRTAAELGVAYWEHAALVSLRVLLLAGRVRVDMRYMIGGDPTAPVCLGGWVARLAPERAGRAYILTYACDGPLWDLYFPRLPPAWDATTAQACDALTAFLDGSSDPWGAAIGDGDFRRERL